MLVSYQQPAYIGQCHPSLQNIYIITPDNEYSIGANLISEVLQNQGFGGGGGGVAAIGGCTRCARKFIGWPDSGNHRRTT